MQAKGDGILGTHWPAPEAISSERPLWVLAGFRWPCWTRPAILRICLDLQAGWVPGVNSQSRWTMQQERWLSVDEIAAHMGVNPDTVYKWIERKRLPAHKMGRLWKFKASEVDEWVRQGKAARETRD